MTNSENTEIIFEDIRQNILNQGIILRVLVDIMIEKNVISEAEFDKRIVETNNKVQQEIKELEDEMDNLDENPDMFYGQGGEA